MRAIPYGDANFENIRTENWLYVDKTMYIEKLEETPDRRKTIYLRPRRFGKSLFTSMLTYYYSVDTKNNFEKLFKGLYIYDNPTKNKNNYYVLNFNFSGMSIDENNIIEDGKRAFAFSVKESLRNFINRYKLNITLEGETAADLLLNVLVSFKSLNLKNKIYIIIDEYDNFTNAVLKGDAQDFLDLVNRNGYVRAFYEVIKSKIEEGIIERFFATGVMPVTLDNLTSGFNIATNLSKHPQFTSMIGFTHDEVKQIIGEVIPEKDIVHKIYEDLEANYDGYRFSLDSEEKTFNSTLVMYYLKNYLELNKPPRVLLDVNMNTSGDKIKRIVELINPQNNYKIVEELLLKNEVAGELQDVVLLDNKYNSNTFITMLFHLGYLTIKDARQKTFFTMPNYITSTIYSEYMAEFLRKKKEYNINTQIIEEAIEQFGDYGDITKIADLVKQFLQYSSIRDMENFSEKNLKYTFAMFLSLTKQYIVYGEYPAGLGFADILVQKATSSTATYEAVIELKYIPKQKSKKISSKKKLISEAKKQLAGYMEDKRLCEKENLKKYVIVFNGFNEYFLEEI